MTRWEVDGLGRVARELRADGNESRYCQRKCAAACPPAAAMVRIVEAPLAMRAAERRDQIGCRCEQDAVAGLDCFQPQRHCQMGFANAWRPEHQYVVAMLDVMAARQRLNLFLVDRWLIGEVEGLDRLGYLMVRRGFQRQVKVYEISSIWIKTK